MKKALLTLTMLAVATASAQESYTTNATAGQVADLAAIVTAHNERVCWRLNQADNCNQATACTAGGATGGASCTAAQARAAKVRIYPNTQAGREEYNTFETVAPAFIERKEALRGHYQEQMCRNWAGFNQAQRESACAALGLPTSCKICP